MSVQFRKRAQKRGLIRIELEPAIPAGEGVEARPAIAVHISPIGAADLELASMSVAANLASAKDSAAALERYGFANLAADAIPTNLLIATREGREALLAMELGIRHIKAWEGYTLDGEALAPVTPEAVTLLMNEWSDGGQSYGAIFIARAGAQSTLEPGARKDSAVSPDMSTGEAAKPAGVAAN